MIKTLTSILRGGLWLTGVVAIMLALGQPTSVAGQTVVPSGKVAAGAPCCEITAIDLNTGVVTAVNQSNQPFRFQVVLSDPPKGRTTPFQPINGIKLLRSLKVGQKVYVNFDTKKVSITGIQPCCQILGTPGRP